MCSINVNHDVIYCQINQKVYTSQKHQLLLKGFFEFGRKVLDPPIFCWIIALNSCILCVKMSLEPPFFHTPSESAIDMHSVKLSAL